MNLSVLYHSTAPASASPYRLSNDQGQEITWANDFLDAQRIRQLSLRSIRAYAYDLLHFARWWLQRGSPNLLQLQLEKRDGFGEYGRLIHHRQIQLQLGQAFAKREMFSKLDETD